MSEHHVGRIIHHSPHKDHHLKPETAAQQAAEECEAAAARLLADSHHPGRPGHPHSTAVTSADVPPTLQELHEKYRNVAGGPQATQAAAKMFDDLLCREGIKRV